MISKMVKKSKNQLKKIEKASLLLEKQIKAFDDYYGQQYGVQRWQERLKPALLQGGKHVALVNPYVKNRKDLEQVLGIDSTDSNDKMRTVPYLSSYIPNVYIRQCHLDAIEEPAAVEADLKSLSLSISEKLPSFDADGNTDDQGESTDQWPSPTTCLDENGLAPYYPMDAASLIPVMLLQLEPHHTVLDLCAAPGGKSLAISHQLDFSQAFLQCNDVSPNRRSRLVNVLKRYLPESSLARTDVSLGDATTKRFGQLFDRILIDAPCSSERHLLRELQHSRQYHPDHIVAIQAKQFMSWSDNRCKNNAERQLALLLNGIYHCNHNARLVYSTCALSDLENDAIIEKLMTKIEKRNKKHPQDQLRILVHPPSHLPFGEATAAGGWQILPDENPLGWGPIYAIALTIEHIERGDA